MCAANIFSTREIFSPLLLCWVQVSGAAAGGWVTLDKSPSKPLQPPHAGEQTHNAPSAWHQQPVYLLYTATFNMTLVNITSHFLTCLSSGRRVDNGLLQFPTNKTHATDTIETQIRVGDVFWTILISRYQVSRYPCLWSPLLSWSQSVGDWIGTNDKQAFQSSRRHG